MLKKKVFSLDAINAITVTVISIKKREGQMCLALTLNFYKIKGKKKILYQNLSDYLMGNTDSAHKCCLFEMKSSLYAEE